MWSIELFLKNRSIFKETTEKSIFTIEDFLKTYEKYKDLDLQKGISFKERNVSKTTKITPSLQIASPEEAKDIAEIFNKVYHGTYPYKELMNEKEIRKMILDPAFYWTVFKVNSKEIIGCIGFHIDLKNKSATFHGFAIKKEYQGVTDLLKLLIAGFYTILHKYHKKVLIWFCEVRSAHRKSQFLAAVQHLIPSAFFPKKDIFFKKEESEFLHILYDSDALKKYRKKERPKIIPRMLNSYIYAFEKFQIGLPEIKNHKRLKFNNNKIEDINRNLIRKVEKDNIGNELITISIKNNNSFISFLYNPLIRIFEKTEYQVSNKEELYLFITEVKKLIKKKRIRYFECFVSGYKPSHQIILYDAGLRPFGYIPSFKYNRNENVFEDQIAFIYYEGKVNGNLKLIPENEKFLKIIKPLWDF